MCVWLFKPDQRQSQRLYLTGLAVEQLLSPHQIWCTVECCSLQRELQWRTQVSYGLVMLWNVSALLAWEPHSEASLLVQALFRSLCQDLLVRGTRALFSTLTQYSVLFHSEPLPLCFPPALEAFIRGAVCSSSLSSDTVPLYALLHLIFAQRRSVGKWNIRELPLLPI